MKLNCFVLNFRMVVVLVFAAVISTGCGSKGFAPIKNISDAEIAIKSAKEANATINAPLDIRIAEDKLQTARENIKKDDYVSARRLADEALMDAKLAQEKSRTAKAKKLENQLRETIETLQNELDRKKIQ